MRTIQSGFVWQGRIDNEEPGQSLRWHQVMQAWSPQEGQSAAVLLGFAVDEGVRRNKGRPGASEGPQACRQALANLPVLAERPLRDAGDVGCADQDLDAAQQALADRVQAIVSSGGLPLVMGGGHEVAWGHFQGLVRARPEVRRWLIVNLDAHFDLRDAAQANSGTPFRQMREWCLDRGLPFTYQVLGVSRFANTQALFDKAHAWGVRHWLDEAVQTEAGLHEAQRSLAQDLTECEAVYLTCCLDVLPAPQAPGVSAPAVLGMPLAHVEAVVDQVVQSGKLQGFDVAELNPSLDRDGLTARVAARLLARVAASHAR